MAHDEIESAACLAKRFHKGNKIFLAIGFTLIGMIEGVARWESSSERGNVSSGLEKLWTQMSALKEQVVEIKTIIADAEKKAVVFDAQFNSIEARLRKVETDAAKMEGERDAK